MALIEGWLLQLLWPVAAALICMLLLLTIVWIIALVLSYWEYRQAEPGINARLHEFVMRDFLQEQIDRDEHEMAEWEAWRKRLIDQEMSA